MCETAPYYFNWMLFFHRYLHDDSFTPEEEDRKKAALFTLTACFNLPSSSSNSRTSPERLATATGFPDGFIPQAVGFSIFKQNENGEEWNLSIPLIAMRRAMMTAPVKTLFPPIVVTYYFLPPIL